MAAQTDLWGELQIETMRTPVAILREQAALLGPKTQNIIEAKVDTAANAGTFFHTFSLVVAALDNYQYQLFRITHQIELYPVYVDGIPPLKTQEAFGEWLHAKLSSPETRRIISSLLAQARS